MLYIIPTKKGRGIELWGTYQDLDALYEVVGKFWKDENYLTKKGFESRDKLIAIFSYEIRKAKDHQRLRRNTSHFSTAEQAYFGTQISWVQILFTITSIKYNMHYSETNKFDIATILQIEYWLEKAMNSYDEVGAKELIGFIDDGLYGANDNIYQYMSSIDLDFILLNGGKRAFRQLPKLLKRGIFYTPEYKEYASFLEKEAARLNCNISDLQINDDHIDYEHMKW